MAERIDSYGDVDSPIVSVIVPVYNCAPVITRCLDSIDYHQAEILVVDDGSTDSSAQVISEYAISHKNVTLLKKSNGGVSSARNLGISCATGKYIMFIDADDYLVPEGLGHIIRIAEETNADVVKYIIRSVRNDSSLCPAPLSDFPITKEIIEGRGSVLMRYDVSDYHVVDGLYRRDLIVNNNVSFHTDLSLREDDVFMGELYCFANTVVSTNLPLYCYVRSSAFSSTHNQNIEKQRLLIKSGELAVKYRKEKVEQFIPDALPLERLKYMRFVALPQTAIKAHLSLTDYKTILNSFHSLGCYPLDNEWIHVARLDGSKLSVLKLKLKTFLCNHPHLAYSILKPFYRVKGK